ncbi:MAG: queuosine precursor transporter [Sphingobacteriaceae bacterium]|nr:queuosine precursor transporter [Sphingobacteriaceae bacterium]MBK7818043.1 queuosine precursor transporter [Sphingobacteriaceae bacterium]
MNLSKRKDIVFIILAGFFITNAIVAELIGGKLVQFFGLFTQSIGIILWPVVFLLTDIINEYYGKSGVRKLTYITVGLIIYTYILITIGINMQATNFSPVPDDAFKTVFGQSQWIIIGSIVAFLFSQLIDVYFFWVFRRLTKGKMIWLRATASTVISQFFDTFIVQFIAFVLPGNWAFEEYLKNASMGYVFKLLVALALIPVIYFLHGVIHKYIKTAEEEGVKN